jgi:hypothetical protein
VKRSRVRLSGLLLLALTGCAQTLFARAPALLPARVPVSVFPSIWVAGGGSADERYLLDRLAADLARDQRREVRRVDPAQLAAARGAGQVSSLTAVVTLDLKLRSGTRRNYDMVPVQYCGMYGCSTQFQGYVEIVPELAGEVLLTVAEGPSGRVLQIDRSTQSVIGDREDVMHTELLEDFARQLAQAVEISQTSERFELAPSKLTAAREGVELLARGKLVEGRSALERAARALGGHDKRTQAAVWYDLGVARYLAPGEQGLTPQALADAERAFTWAHRLSPEPRHQRALARVAEAHKRLALIAQQRLAEEHNFALVTGGSR